MEIKATLNKPYTDSERLDFIIEQNHHKGYEIKETYEALEAWGLTAEEQEEQDKQIQKQKLIEQLDALDLKCIRALRAISAGQGTQADTEKLAELQAQAVEIRRQMQAIDEVLKGE